MVIRRTQLAHRHIIAHSHRKPLVVKTGERYHGIPQAIVGTYDDIRLLARVQLQISADHLFGKAALPHIDDTRYDIEEVRSDDPRTELSRIAHGQPVPAVTGQERT